MRKTYRYDNALVHIVSLDKYDRENFKKATQEFLKKVMREGKRNGNSDTRRDFREKQVLHR